MTGVDDIRRLYWGVLGDPANRTRRLVLADELESAGRTVEAARQRVLADPDDIEVRKEYGLVAMRDGDPFQQEHGYLVLREATNNLGTHSLDRRVRDRIADELVLGDRSVTVGHPFMKVPLLPVKKDWWTVLEDGYGAILGFRLAGGFVDSVCLWRGVQGIGRFHHLLERNPVRIAGLAAGDPYTHPAEIKTRHPGVRHWVSLKGGLRYGN